MSADLHVDDRAGWPASAAEPRDRRRPNVSGDLPSVLATGPMFRRALGGYDRFQVDTYAQWAEDELATADREREDLEARHLATRAALGEARELLSHSSGGGEFLHVSRRIGSMLAAASDEAESIRAQAEDHRSAASARAEEMVAGAEGLLAGAEAEAGRIVARAVAESEESATAAGRIVAEAERTRRDAATRLQEVRALEQRGAEHAERVRRQAAEEAIAARLQARDEVVRMLATAREERRRVDADAAATRERLDRDAAARRASLLAEVAHLEHRLATLRAEVQPADARVAASSAALHMPTRPGGEWVQHRLGSSVLPRRSASTPPAPAAAGDGVPTDA